MASVNKAILVGNLGQDPELKYTPSGTAICTFTLATTDRFKDRDGNQQERTEWHRIKIWAKQAEIAAEYLKKGRQVYIEGRIETRSWDQDGQKRYMTEIVVERFQMLGTRGDSAGGGRSDDDSESSAKKTSAPSSSDNQPDDEAPPDELQNDEDLPF